MITDYSSAIQILIVGMFAVFAILSLVVFLGGFLIRIVNYYTPDKPSERSLSSTSIRSNSSVESKKIAVIASAVQIASNGKARVVQVQKVS